MTTDEQALIDFALVWQPFHGPPAEDILTSFGLTPPQFRARIRGILTAPGTRLDAPLRQHARAVLRSYLPTAGHH
ncbi:hypothetical protein [Nocardia sp. NPDC046763]|uniref:hypothetical protein n=1 Tax=Nocardia sp. NPDC046763 TaxID=3155256 RepID=UPI0033C3E342